MPAADYTPTVEDIAALIPTRAKGEWGDVGRFDTTTKPTAAQVESLIVRTMPKFTVRIGQDLKTPELIVLAKHVVSLRVAMLIELTKFQEQIRTGQSPYRELKELWDEEWPDLLDAITDVNGDDDPDDGSISGPGGAPLGSFDLCDAMIGMHTEW